MNLTLLLVLAIIVLAAIHGYKKGMTKEITGLISWVVTLFVISLLIMLFTSFRASEGRNTVYTVIILASVAVVNGIVRLFLKSAKLLSKLPIFHALDVLLGIIVGAAEGLLIVWLLYILNEGGLFGAFGEKIIADTMKSEILSSVYEYNYLAKLVAFFR